MYFNDVGLLHLVRNPQALCYTLKLKILAVRLVSAGLSLMKLVRYSENVAA